MMDNVSKWNNPVIRQSVHLQTENNPSPSRRSRSGAYTHLAILGSTSQYWRGNMPLEKIWKLPGIWSRVATSHNNISQLIKTIQLSTLQHPFHRILISRYTYYIHKKQRKQSQENIWTYRKTVKSIGQLFFQRANRCKWLGYWTILLAHLFV